MVANGAQESSGLYVTVEQYLFLDESSDAKYEYLDGYAYMLRPPCSAYDDRIVLDLAGGSTTHAALSARIVAVLDDALSVCYTLYICSLFLIRILPCLSPIAPKIIRLLPKRHL